jgi:hypothetical protein
MILSATVTCPNCGHQATEEMPTTAWVHFYQCLACHTVLRPKPGDCCVFCSYSSSRCPRRQAEGLDAVHRLAAILGSRMEISLVRVVATLLLSGQILPVGLPLLCDQVQRATSANCEQQMASHPSGPAVAATTHATPCANTAFCATTATAVVALGGAVSASAGESHTVGCGVSTLVPADPRAPLPPPPQA